MIRRQYVLLVLFTVIFQIFFSPTSTLSLNNTDAAQLSTRTSTLTASQSTNKCEPASIDEFPPLFFTDEQRRRGGILVYVVLILYSFAAIEIVCDDYFASALERISCNLNLTPDVAGATFMALATSASEFFTSIVGVFFVKSDIALGTIVGSAVFNILFVIALCALISTTVCELDGYPIVRDAGFYCIAVAALYIVIYDQRVYWYEAFALVLLYFVYVGILKFNDRLSRLMSGNATNQKTSGPRGHPPEQLQALNNSVELEENLPTRGRSVSESVMMSTATHTSGAAGDDDVKRRLPYKPSKRRLKDTPDNLQIVANATEIFDPLKLPTKRYKILKWVLMYPVRLLMHITIPDCRKEVFNNYYMLTFVMSTIWVAGLAYLLVWLVVIVGFTLNIPDSIMGLTVLAFGSSIEEIFSAIVMTRRGHPEMAIAGSIGSNVFDILMGLGVPWLFRNLMRFTHQPTPYEASPIITGGSLSAFSSSPSDPAAIFNHDNLGSSSSDEPFFVEIHSRGLVYSTVVLFVAIITFLITFFVNRCRLTKFYGVFLIVIWLSVVTLMCLLELNIFGALHPIPCRNRLVSTV
ncbi:unnamed protein product [Rotaria magnacalcarata]|uniref:Sodium/calcium exchanger membrane region domain-containing protein n=2 Tax=Rotaria magnacalcarata TaxID=392030 RepID=A0A816ZZM0_9BILA|nr:unnamed protein product [Rotaria magnacalcarata]CAF1390474.1 unnamed protein product [Rotaria magnacalcarata]CAF2232939.1 unnamed protein product [Rotaria magnacalcarata]